MPTNKQFRKHNVVSIPFVVSQIIKFHQILTAYYPRKREKEFVLFCTHRSRKKEHMVGRFFPVAVMWVTFFYRKKEGNLFFVSEAHVKWKTPTAPGYCAIQAPRQQSDSTHSHITSAFAAASQVVWIGRFSDWRKGGGKTSATTRLPSCVGVGSSCSVPLCTTGLVSYILCCAMLCVCACIVWWTSVALIAHTSSSSSCRSSAVILLRPRSSRTQTNTRYERDSVGNVDSREPIFPPSRGRKTGEKGNRKAGQTKNQKKKSVPCARHGGKAANVNRPPSRCAHACVGECCRPTRKGLKSRSRSRCEGGKKGALAWQCVCGSMRGKIQETIVQDSSKGTVSEKKRIRNSAPGLPFIAASERKRVAKESSVSERETP